jgi:hypothetical protein
MTDSYRSEKLSGGVERFSLLSARNADVSSATVQELAKTAPPFADSKEERAAIADPRYRTDGNYRAEVNARQAAGLRPTAQPSGSPQVHQIEVTRASISDRNGGNEQQMAAQIQAQPYRTREEIRAAVRHPEYKRSATFRAQHTARLAVTDSSQLI